MGNIKQYGVDQLVGTYIKVMKPTQVYSSVTYVKTPVEWQGWTLQAGQNAGKLWSWIEGDGTTFAKGLFMMFQTAQGKFYYIKVERKLIDWTFTDGQLTQKRRDAMNWYEKIYDDIETSIETYVDEVKSYVTSALWVGGSIVVFMLYWNTIGKYQVQAKVYQGLLRTTVKELRR